MNEPSKEDLQRARVIRKNFSGTTMDSYAVALLEDQVLKALVEVRAESERKLEDFKKRYAEAEDTVKLLAEKSALEEREANYLETIGQDTRTIKGLRREIGLLEDKVKGLMEASQLAVECHYRHHKKKNG